jgi:hypothetical protein
MTGSLLGGMMKVMRPEHAKDFYEEDEDPARIENVFDTGEKGYTASARGPRVRHLRGQTLGGIAVGFAADIRNLRLRERAAAGLRLLADLLESNSRERGGMRPPGTRIGSGRRTRSHRW